MINQKSTILFILLTIFYKLHQIILRKTKELSSKNNISALDDKILI